MARTIAKTVNPERMPAADNMKMEKFVEARVNLGMITQIDPSDIPTGALQLAKNATVRFDRTSRRYGTVLLTPIKPNALTVLKTLFIKKNNGSPYTLRFTPTTVHSRQAAGWSPYTTLAALTGTVSDRISTAFVLDNLVFANNGADEIQLVNFAAETHADLGNAPKYRYVTGFYNRVVGAALRGVNEVQIGWSGDGNIAEWNPITDESSGNSPLVESPSDLSDYITGVFGLSNVLIVLREQSVWVGYKQPIAQFPFNFQAAIPGVGCDAPHSATVILGGVAWLDTRTAGVYAYTPGGELDRIGQNVESEIIKNVTDPKNIFGSYNPVFNEYTVCIPQVGSTLVRAWTYNFRTKAWVFSEYDSITSLDDTDLGTAGTTIDQLVGSIDNLQGTIDSLSPTAVNISTRLFGKNTGDILLENPNADRDAQLTPTSANDGLIYETVLATKTFNIPEVDTYIAQVRIDYRPIKQCTLTLEYSKDGGDTDGSWKVAKSVTPVLINKTQLLIFNKNIKTRKFAFRVRASNGLFELVAFEIHVYPGGKSDG